MWYRPGEHLLKAESPLLSSQVLNPLLRAFEEKAAYSSYTQELVKAGSPVNSSAVRLDMLVTDGVYTVELDKPTFHRVNAPAQSELEALLTRIIARITRHLQRDGLLVAAEPPTLSEPESGQYPRRIRRPIHTVLGHSRGQRGQHPPEFGRVSTLRLDQQDLNLRPLHPQ
ncbi:MAG: hypothetical protein CMP86_06220 [Gammaproteobacteria bacterium]|nr:hypothetical protein [Gammaproteobacteria bacterium]